MKHVSAVAFILIGTCLGAESKPADITQELITLERSFNQALVRGDWKYVERTYADEIIFTSGEGTVTGKSDAVSGLKSGDIKFESVEIDDVRVQGFGNVAVVTGKLVERGHYKTDDLSGTYRFTDVWAKRNGRWQIVAGQETRVVAEASGARSS